MTDRDATKPALPLEHMCLFRKMLDRSPDGSVLFDDTGRVIYCNAAVAKMSGAADRQSVLPLWSRDFYANPERDLPVVLERLKVDGAVKALDVRVPEERFCLWGSETPSCLVMRRFCIRGRGRRIGWFGAL